MGLLDGVSPAGAVRLTGMLVATVAVGACCIGVSSASAAAVVNTIPVGGEPEGVSSDGTHVWVANLGSDSVSEIDASTGTVVNTIPVGVEPIGVSSDGTHVWVTNYFSAENTVSEIDASTGTVIRTISLGTGLEEVYPGGVSSDGTHVWVTPFSGASHVSEIDASTGTVVNRIPIGNESEGSAAVSSDGTHVWVANREDGEDDTDGTVSEIDASTGTVVTTIPVGNDPDGVSSDGTHVWVTGYNSDDDGTVTEIDASTGTVVQTIPVGSISPYAFGGAVSSDGTHVWVANSGDDTVSEILIGAEAPAITNLSVRSGPIAGGTSVVVTGSGFGSPGDADTVSFVPQGGGAPIPVAPADMHVVSNTEIDVTTPDVREWVPSDGGVLQTNVQVTNTDGTFSTIGDAGEFNFPGTVVELGDSIAAGEGTLDGFSYSPASPNGLWGGGVANAPGIGLYPDCHDSPYAYGQVLSDALGVNFVNLACTGASYAEGIIGPEVFDHALGPNVTVPAQFPSSAYDEAQPDAVVMTYGADDVQFSSIVKACIASDVSIAGDTSVGTPPPAPECVASNPGSTIETDFFDELPALPADDRHIVSAIKSRGDEASPPRVPKIIFTDYMDPFPASGTCNDTWPLTEAQVSYLNTLVAALNSSIEADVNFLDDPDVSFADISGALTGHTWCTSEPWDYGLSISTGGGQLGNFLSGAIGSGYASSDAPFHPTPAGQDAVAALVKPVVAAALGMNGTGAAVTSASGNGGGSADGVTAEPGDSVSFDASGFTPGEPVDETLHSTPVVLGSVTADGSGDVSATVTIPVDTPAGSHDLLLTGETSGFTATLPVVIPAPTAPPVLTTDSPPLTVPSGTPYTGYFGASSVPTPTYALAPGAPEWLSIDPSFAGIVSGTPPSGTTSFTYSVIASNGVDPNATAGPFTVAVTAGSESLAGSELLAGSGLTGVLGAKEETKAPATGSISLDGSTISIRRNHEALIKLTCTGTAGCSGKLTFTVKRTTGKVKHRHTRMQTIGTSNFSIPAGKSDTVTLTLNGTGRSLLNAAHGRLRATLAILKSSPSPSNTQTHGVHLAQQKTKAKKSKK
jgi:YVTN family beta-propeller protein